MMASTKFPAWRRDKNQGFRKNVACCAFFSLVILLLIGYGVLPSSFTFCKSYENAFSNTTLFNVQRFTERPLNNLEYDCLRSPQAGPVVAHKVEKVSHPFFISLADIGTLEKPNRNFQRILKGKLFQKPAISETIQNILQKAKSSGFDNGRSLVIDVGANIGMASFAAAAMGYNVLAFEPVTENVQKICDGIYLNRASSTVQLYNLAVSDAPGHITMHKVVGRLDNSAVSATGAKLAFKSNEVIPVTIQSVTLDSMIEPSVPVLLLKIDVQGWEYHVLKGASKLLSRPPHEAPYVIYEDDDKLLHESNSTSAEILQFLERYGYKYCVKEGGDRHCTKEKPW